MKPEEVKLTPEEIKRDCALGDFAKVILANTMNKYLSTELTKYICNDFISELGNKRSELLLAAWEGDHGEAET